MIPPIPMWAHDLAEYWRQTKGDDVANGNSEHSDIYNRINHLETGMAKLETELPHVIEAVKDVKKWQVGTVTTIVLSVILYIVTQAIAAAN